MTIADLLPTYIIGLTLVLIPCFFWYFRNRPHFIYFCEQNFRYAAGFLVAVFSIVLLFQALNREFNVDELEHIHSTWYVNSGFMPYRDFFQHHHPLMWLLFSPVLSLLPESAGLLVVFRLINLLFVAGIFWMVFRLGTRVTNSPEAGLYGLILVASVNMFAYHSIEIRPDIPQVFFGLVALNYLLEFLQRKRTVTIILSGLFTAVSFLFLQKSVILIISLFFLFLLLMVQKRIGFHSVAFFSITFIIPITIFCLFLLAQGIFSDYMLTNWHLNINFGVGDSFGIMKNLRQFVLKDIAFWLIALSSLLYILIRRQRKSIVLILAALTLFQFAALFVYRRPHGYYFLFSISLFAVCSGYGMQRFFTIKGWNGARRMAFLVLISFVPLFFGLGLTADRNKEQLDQIEYVLQKTDRSDCVYDGDNRFNLFRRDCHYFWYSLKPMRGLETYNRITDGRYRDYDILAEIMKRKPAVISDWYLDMGNEWLIANYRSTPFSGIFRRVEEW